MPAAHHFMAGIAPLPYWSTGVLEYWSMGVLEYCRVQGFPHRGLSWREPRWGERGVGRAGQCVRGEHGWITVTHWGGREERDLYRTTR